MEVRHIPLSVDDVPKELMDLFKDGNAPYVCFYRTELRNTTQIEPIKLRTG